MDLVGLADLRLLAGDGREVAQRAVDELGVLGGVADTHVHDDLDHARDLHGVGVANCSVSAGLISLR
jgi:hypothetical protein